MHGTVRTKPVILFCDRSLQHHQDLILMLQGRNCRNLEKEKGLWQRRNSRRWNRSWKRMWLCCCLCSFLCPFFVWWSCFCSSALWYPILSVMSPQWPFLEDAGSHTTSVNYHDQSLQENYRTVVCIVKFFKLLFSVNSEDWKQKIHKFIKDSRKGNNDFLKHTCRSFYFYLQGLSHYPPGSLVWTSAFYQGFCFSYKYALSNSGYFLLSFSKSVCVCAWMCV